MNPTKSLAFACVIAAWASVGGAQSPGASPPPLPPAPAATPAPDAARPASPAPPAGAPAIVIESARGAEARDAEPPPSRWQSDLDRLDADLRLRLLTANEPRTHWLAGELDTADIESQVRHYAAARTAAPGERLYLASLGVACLQPVRPSLALCDAVDRLADWARRDTDNGVPSLLLAGRARQRGEAELAASFVEQAAGAPRFDDYWAQGADRWWEYLRALDVGVDPAAKAKAAANYALIRDLPWATPLRALCAEPGQRVERMRNACANVGRALMARGTSFALLRAGARVAEINAADAPARAAAQARHARILTMTARCALLQPDFASALESPQAPVRARAIEQFAAWASAQSQFGEVAACERVLASAPR
jgi:hypothetical protein